MKDHSADIAIIGAGPAGAHLASRLAAAGRSVVLFDPKGAWEKPCGGGVPTRAIREFGFLLESSGYPRKVVNRITMISPNGRRVRVKFDEPFAIYSREVLNRLVLDRAIEDGARFEHLAVKDFSREENGWTITTYDGGKWRANFLVGADGAASPTRRRLIGIFPVQDLALAFGYNVVADQPDNGNSSTENQNGNAKLAPSDDEVVVRFSKNFTGYLWAFPRPGVMNFGVASKLGEHTSDELRALLTEFVKDYYGGQLPPPERMSLFGAKIPTLDLKSWPDLKASGDGWALVGDAAGFCDPITGEGIYYAFKSADLLGDAFAELPVTVDSNDVAVDLYNKAAARYEISWREAFGHELKEASYRLPRFYRGRFFGQDFTDALVRLARYHRGVRTILVRAMMGDQSYVTLKHDLLSRVFHLF